MRWVMPMSRSSTTLAEHEHDLPVRPEEHEVLDAGVGEGRLAAHDVDHGGRALVGRAEPQRRLAAGALAEVAAVPS
jgi:hypothetical protein